MDMFLWVGSGQTTKAGCTYWRILVSILKLQVFGIWTTWCLVYILIEITISISDSSRLHASPTCSHPVADFDQTIFVFRSGVCDVTRPCGRRSTRNLQSSARGLCKYHFFGRMLVMVCWIVEHLQELSSSQEMVDYIDDFIMVDNCLSGPVWGWILKLLRTGGLSLTSLCSW